MKPRLRSIYTQPMATRLRLLVAALIVVVSVLAIVAFQREGDGLPAEAGLSEADRNRLHVLGYDPWVEEAPVAGRKTGVVVAQPDRMSPGYTLFAGRGAREAYLLAPDGRVVHRWQGSGRGFWGDTALLEDGTLLLIGATSNHFDDHADARYLRALDWGSEIRWQSDFPAHHDIERTPDGRLLTLGFVDRQVDGPKGPEWIIDDQVVVASADGRKEEEYSLYDLFTASPEIAKLRWATGSAERERRRVVDLFHANSVQWLEGNGRDPIFADGNILVSIRHQNLMVVFDPRRRRLVWAWGGRELRGPHHARMLADGNVTIFDNGLGRKFSRGLEMDPSSGEVVWQFPTAGSRDFYTHGGGSVQRLSNGNTLLCEGEKGQLFEVAPDGEIVWQFVNPMQPGRNRRGAIHSASRVPAELVEPLLARLH